MRKIPGIATLLGIALAIYLRPFPPTQAASGNSVSAIYQQGTLRVTIPYRAPHAGAGRLTVEVLDPEDRVRAHADHLVGANAGSGWWHEELKPGTPMSAEDLVWHRLRYRFQYGEGKDAAIAGTESISQILARPLIHILGQQSYFAGGAAAVRVIATDTHNESVGDGMLRIELNVPNQKPRTLFTGRMNQRGTAEAQFRFPAGLAGSFPLHYAVDTAIGPAEFTQQVRLEEKASVLLTTEKPIYQPGQTIHVRALALNPADHEAAAARSLTFEVQDSRGNKVFKKATQTDAFGLASAEFALADEVNLGAWHLRALTGEGASAAEVTIQVDRYVLPKFKVAVELDASQAGSHGYRPGDHVKGTVRANYFFGKPVEGEVTLKGSAMDVAVFQVAELSGKTDGEGAWHFDLKLPDYFAGRPLSQGAAQVLLEASVKDSAGHTETHGAPITVSQSPLIVTAVPEGGSLAPGMENQVFVLTSYADGKPAAADLRVMAGGPEQRASTDAGGVAVVTVMPQAGKMWQIEAEDHEGNHATARVNLEVRAAGDQVLLRSERAVYRAGERIVLKVFSTKQRGAAYVDVVRQGQTMLTRDLELVNGQAELTLTATPDLAGTVDFNAYIFGETAQPVSDHRLVFVQPADELKVEATADAAVYKPGDDARIRFRVTNSRGEGVRAALGLQVVDEAVFALAEKQPGFAKVFFYLEQEVMKPRYEIHSIGMPEAIETGNAVRHERAARALFAATEMVNSNRFETEVGRPLPMARYSEYATRYRTVLMAQMKKLAEGAGKREFRSAAAKVSDSWGSRLRVDNWGGGYVVRSAGPDKQLDTWDDLLLRVDDGDTGVVLRDDIGFGWGGGVGRGKGGGGGGVRMEDMARLEMVPMAGNAAFPMAAPMAAMDARASTGTLKKSDVEKDQEGRLGWRRSRPIVFPGGAVHQPGDPHRPARHGYNLDSAGRFDYHVADGDDGVHREGRAGQRHFQSEGIPGFLRGPGHAGDGDAGRPGDAPGGGLQLLAGAGRHPTGVAGGRLVPAGGGQWEQIGDGGPGARGRVAVHAGGDADREIQADALGADDGGGEAGGHRGAGDRSGSQRPRAERGFQWPARSFGTAGGGGGARGGVPAEFHRGGGEGDGAAVSRALEPGDGRDGRDSADARGVLRADVFEHLSERAGARLHEDHGQAFARGARQGGGLYRQRLSAAGDLRSAGRGLLVVRASAGQ